MNDSKAVNITKPIKWAIIGSNLHHFIQYHLFPSMVYIVFHLYLDNTHSQKSQLFQSISNSFCIQNHAWLCYFYLKYIFCMYMYVYSSDGFICIDQSVCRSIHMSVSNHVSMISRNTKQDEMCCTKNVYTSRWHLKVKYCWTTMCHVQSFCIYLWGWSHN